MWPFADYLPTPFLTQEELAEQLQFQLTGKGPGSHTFQALARTTMKSPMSAHEFIAKWGPGGPAYALNERAGAQSHFIDLCLLLGLPTPGSAEDYCFEKGLIKTGPD